MKRIIFLIAAILPLFCWGTDKEQLVTAISDDVARHIGEAYQLTGLSQVVNGQAADYLNNIMKDKLQALAAKVFQKALSGAAVNGRVNLREAISKLRQSPEAKAKIVARLKIELKDWLPEVEKKILYDGLFGGDAKLAELEQKIVASLDTTLNQKLDDIINQWYGQAVNELNDVINPCGSSSQAKICGKMNLAVDVTDLDKTLRSAFDFQNVSAAASYPLAQAFGEATVEGFRSHIKDALNGQLPQELVSYLDMGPEKFAEYAAKIKKNLPGAKLDEALDKAKARVLGQPLFALPNGAYGGVLAGTAAAHFAKGLLGCPLHCNWYEINRGREVTGVFIWQMKNKEAVSLTVGSFLDLAKVIGGTFGVDKIGGIAQLKVGLGDIGARLKKIEDLAGKVDKLITSPLDKLQGLMDNSVALIKDELLAFQDELLGPLKDFKLPNLPKLPKELGGLPKKLNAPDNLFGELGNINPVKEVSKKLAKLNDILAGSVADMVGQTVPTTSIDKDEKIPAQNPSQTSAFDPVFLHNGEFYHRVKDFRAAKEGLSYEFIRIYRSRVDFDGPMGHNWVHNYDERLMVWPDSPDGPGIVWLTPGGEKYFFKKDGVKYVPLPGVFYGLLNDGRDSFILQSPDGLQTVFNSYGLLVAKRDRVGRETRFFYDGNGRLNFVRDGVGRRFNYEYDDGGRLTGIVAPDGRRLKFLYNDNGDLVEATDTDGRTTKYQYLAHKLISITDPKGQIYLRNSYGEDGENRDKVVTQVYGDDRYKIQARYEENKTCVTDKRGVARIYEHDGEGHLVSEHIIDEGGRRKLISRHFYDTNGLRIKTKFPGGKFVFNKYSDTGLLSSEAICPPSADEACRVTTFIYGPHNELVRVVDPMGRVIRLDTGQLANQQTSNGPTGKPVNQLAGLSVSQPEPMYDANGNIIKITSADGAVTEFDYDVLDHVTHKRVKVADGKFSETKYEYDAGENLARIILPEGNIIERVDDARYRPTYNPFGEPIAETDANGNKRFVERDLSGLIIGEKFIDKSGALLVERKFGYDGHGRLVLRRQKLWRDNQEQAEWLEDRLVRDAKGRVIQYVAPDGVVTDIKTGSPTPAYYMRGQVTPFGDDRPIRESKYEYDFAGRLTAIIRGAPNHTVQGGGTTRFTWDGNNRLITATDDNGNTTKYGYDGLDRLVRKQFADGTAVKYSYDAAGRLALIADARGNEIKNEYDPGGNLLLRRGGVSTQSFAYDGLNRAVFSSDGGFKEWYFYDSLSRKTAENQNGRWIVYNHDAVGNKTAIRYPSGETVYRTPRLIYDDEGEIIPRYRYKNQADDGLTGQQATGNGEYSYDTAGRLIEARSGPHRWSWKLDGADNWLEYRKDDIVKKFQVNVVNEYIGEFSYDANGNLISDKNFRYEYDFLNRLTGVYDTGGRRVAVYAYDVYNRRISANGRAFVYDDWDLIEEYGAGGLERSYVYGNRIDKPLRLKDGKNKYYYLSDRLGSIRAITDESGKAIETYNYSPYGSLIGQTSKPVTGNRFGFTAREFDSETGLIYFRNRYYKPDIGRFITRDPLGLKGEVNPYAYAGNDPINAVDPLGLFALKYHETITAHALEKMGLGNITTPAVLGNWATDMFSTPIYWYYGASDVEHKTAIGRHFDNLSDPDQIMDAWHAVAERINAINNGPDIVDVSSARLAAMEIGGVLHSVQDFYAHSNWVEYWNARGKYGGDIPTYLGSDVPEDADLFTGSYGADENKKCPRSHEQLAKDNPKKLAQFYDAELVAARESVYVIKMLNADKLEALKKFGTANPDDFDRISIWAGNARLAGAYQ